MNGFTTFKRAEYQRREEERRKQEQDPEWQAEQKRKAAEQKRKADEAHQLRLETLKAKHSGADSLSVFLCALRLRRGRNQMSQVETFEACSR